MSNVDTETVAPVEAPVETRVPLNEAPVDGPGSGRSTLRKELEKNAEAARKPAAPQPKGQTTKKSRARQEMEEQETPEEAPAEGEVAPAEGETPEEGGAALKAPEGWAKEAKAVWEQLPPAVQTAVNKREADMAKGVDDLKKKQAEIDQVLQPRMEVIRRHGHTPAQAVNQLFSWFEALSANPTVAFPALAQSFKFDLRAIPGLLPQQQQTPAQPAAQPDPKKQPAPEEIPPSVQNYVKTLEQQINELKQGVDQRLGQLSNSFQQQTQAKTEEILMSWAKDKPYFEDVRRVMGQLIQSGTVAPLPNGSADLDKAYDMALWAMPEVRAKVQADQKAKEDAARKAKADAEKKLQQEQADKARKAAAGSLTGGAPGNPPQPGKPKKGKSVRESIMEARQELAE
jgi:hypothetical protein